MFEEKKIIDLRELYTENVIPDPDMEDISKIFENRQITSCRETFQKFDAEEFISEIFGKKADFVSDSDLEDVLKIIEK